MPIYNMRIFCDRVRKKTYETVCRRYSIFTYLRVCAIFDSQAIAKMFTWAFMLRVDMENLGFDSINKYAIGEDIDRYTNKIAMFSVIANARSHHEISNIVVLVKRQPNQAESKRWNGLYADLKKLNGVEE